MTLRQEFDRKLDIIVQDDIDRRYSGNTTTLESHLAHRARTALLADSIATVDTILAEINSPGLWTDLLKLQRWVLDQYTINPDSIGLLTYGYMVRWRFCSRMEEMAADAMGPSPEDPG